MTAKVYQVMICAQFFLCAKKFERGNGGEACHDHADEVQGEFVLNAEIIESIEETPDTVVTLTNGKKLIVEEPMEEIVRRTIKYRRALHQN